MLDSEWERLGDFNVKKISNSHHIKMLVDGKTKLSILIIILEFEMKIQQKIKK